MLQQFWGSPRMSGFTGEHDSRLHNTGLLLASAHNTGCQLHHTLVVPRLHCRLLSYPPRLCCPGVGAGRVGWENGGALSASASAVKEGLVGL